MRTFALAAAAAATAIACGGPVYRLPPAPDEVDRRDVSLDRVEERAWDSDRYRAANRALLALYDALGNERWDDATSLLSQETRVVLAGGGTGDAATALATGTVQVGDTEYAFDPVELLLTPGVREMRDTIDGVEDIETDRRKVVHLLNADGDERAVVLIYEADAWRLHQPSLPRQLVTTTRR